MSRDSEAMKGNVSYGGSAYGIDQLNQNVADLTVKNPEVGGWEQVMKKNRNRAGSSGKQTSIGNPPKAWNRPDATHRLDIGGYDEPAKSSLQAFGQSTDYRRVAGRGVKPQPTIRDFDNRNVPAPPVGIPPPLEHGWNWPGRVGYQAKATKEEDNEDSVSHTSLADIDGDKDVEDVDDPYSDEDDDLLEYDSDASPKSHEERKGHRMLKSFFDKLDSLTLEEVSEPERQWHCPACQGGPGAIDWYRGLQPLLAHARTKGSRRILLHREFAELLDEELHRKGTTLVQHGEAFGQWAALKQDLKDHEIVWPPMVIIMNTKLEKDANERWIGMGNQELLDYFSSYHAVRARHSYGPQGHRGMSVLIFDNSAVGYMEAERLHKHFLEQGTGRDNGDPRRVPLFVGGKRQLYGFLALKDDLELFNRHSQGKSKLKYEMRSYQEMVVSQMKQMSEENQLLTFYKKIAVKEQRHSKALEESLNIVSEKLRKTSKENHIVRQRTKMQTEQNKEEMVYQEQFFKDQVKKINMATEAKEDNFEKSLQRERSKIEQSTKHALSSDDQRRRTEEVVKFIKLQEKEIEEFVAERDKLEKMYEQKNMDMKRRHWAEELELAKEFDAELTNLMEKYAPGHGAGA